MPGGLKSTDSVAVVSDQVSCDVGDELIILSLRQGAYYGLDPVGARVWKLLQEAPRTPSALCDAIADEYDVEYGRCQEDVMRLLEQLRDERLIEIRNGSPA